VIPLHVKLKIFDLQMPISRRRRLTRGRFSQAFRSPFRKKSNRDKEQNKSSRRKTERKTTRKIQGTHVEIFGVENDKAIPQSYKEEYRRLVEELQYWPDEMLQFKMVGESDDYGPLNVLSMLDDIVVFDDNGKMVDYVDQYDELDENGWWDRVERGTQFPYDNISGMMKVLKIIDMKKYIFAAVLFEQLAGRGANRIIYPGEKSLIEWVQKKGDVPDKKRTQFLRKGAKRPSPTPSAKSVDPETVAIGNDDNFYVSRKNSKGIQQWKKITNF
tara:strand:- start:2377 stop:3192 length:816 start_codon:yes stop_codon:yes gene_type:complete